MNLNSIIQKLTGSAATKRTSAELRADLASIDLDALERKVTEIERQRRDLLLRGTDAELLTITQDLTAANLEAERAQAAVDELKRLIAAAEAREKVEARVARAAEAQQARERLIDCYAQADAGAAALASILQQIQREREFIRQVNRETSDGGPELKVFDPVGDLATHLGFGNSDRIPNPLHWTLRGYWPLTDGGGMSLNRDRSLGRARELLAGDHKKAA